MTNEALQILRDSIRMLDRNSGKFRATNKFVRHLEGRSAAARKALASATTSSKTAILSSSRLSQSIRARQP